MSSCFICPRNFLDICNASEANFKIVNYLKQFRFRFLASLSRSAFSHSFRIIAHPLGDDMTESRQLGTMSKARLLILLSLIFVSNGCSFGKRGRTRIHRSDDECVCATAVHYNPLTDTNITVDPHCDCRSSGFGVMRMIPYGICGGTMHVDLSSACVRCSMCVAVAEEVRRISNVFSIQ